MVITIGSIIDTPKQTIWRFFLYKKIIFNFLHVLSFVTRFSCSFLARDESEVVIHSDDAFAPVGFLRFKKMHMEDKEQVPRWPIQLQKYYSTYLGIETSD